MGIHRILVTTDFSAPARVALIVAKDLAERYEAHLTVLHVDEHKSSFPESILPRKTQRTAGPSERLRSRLGDEAALAGVMPDELAVVRDRSAADAILDYAGAHSIDLIVIASLGHSALERLVIGSVAERVVRHARCGVLTVRS